MASPAAQQPLRTVLQILQQQLLQPGRRIVSPALRMCGDHHFPRQLPAPDGMNHIIRGMEHKAFPAPPVLMNRYSVSHADIEAIPTASRVGQMGLPKKRFTISNIVLPSRYRPSLQFHFSVPSVSHYFSKAHGHEARPTVTNYHSKVYEPISWIVLGNSRTLCIQQPVLWNGNAIHGCLPRHHELHIFHHPKHNQYLSYKKFRRN